MGYRVDLSSDAVQIAWSRIVESEIAPKDVLFDPEAGLLGPNGVVIERSEVMKGGGREIRVPYVYQTRARGKTEGQQLINDTSGLDHDTFALKIGTLRHAWSIDDGGMADQTLSFEAAQQLAENAADWAATRLSFAAHIQAAGQTLITDDAYRLYNTISAPTYIVRPNGGTAGALTAANRFDKNVIHDVQQLVKTVRPKIRPAKTPWGEKYVLCIHPEQTRSLMEDDSAWYSAMVASLQGGNQKSGVFTRVLGEFQDFILLESDFIPPGIDGAGTAFQANTRRAWVGGQGALNLAFGRGWSGDPGFSATKWKMISEKHDFEEVKAFGIRSMLGMAKPSFTDPRTSSSHDQAVVVIETWVDHGTLSAATSFTDWTDAAPSVSITAAP